MNTLGTARLVGNQIGDYLDVEKDRNGHLVGRFLRIKVDVLIAKPLHRVLKVSHGGFAHNCVLKYERLPIFYYHCGILGHIDKDCKVRLSPITTSLCRSLLPSLVAYPKPF